VRRSTFWRPPAWKWGVVLALVSYAGFLVLGKPSRVRVELLPFTDSPPEWNGSYPYLSISIDPELENAGFKSSILLIKPSVRHDSPVNEFQVDLHSGLFVLRQTDLFTPGVTSLAADANV
jgi:hypothetical protein